MGQAFDETSAKELHTYLIKPFERYLGEKHVVIVPQGPLVGLPFEALIDADEGKFLAEKLAVSYAPNAAFVMKALEKKTPGASQVTALYDEKIERDTHEIKHMEQIEGLQVTPHSSKGMSAEKTIKLLGGAKIAHVLLHGKYHSDDPLQSTVKIGAGTDLRVNILRQQNCWP